MNQPAENIKPIKQSVKRVKKTRVLEPDSCFKDQFGNEPTIKGTVTLYIPNHGERMKLIGKSKAAEEGSEADQMAELVLLLKPYIKEANITNEEGELLKTYDDLYDDLQGQNVLGEVARCFLAGSFIKKKFKQK